MPNFIFEIPILIPLTTMYLICCSISLSGFFIAKKFFNHVDNRDVITKVVWQTILLFSTLFITFWIANNWHNMKDLNKINEKEAHAIENVFNAASEIKNETQRKMLRQATLNYLYSIINNEFKALKHGKLDPIAQSKYHELAMAIYQYNPSSGLYEQLNYNRLLDAFDKLSSNRIERLNYLVSELRGPLLIFFISLILLGCFWAGCINSKNFIFSLIVILSQNLIITSSAWLIFEMDKPFQGYITINSHPFIAVEQQIQTFKF